MANAIEIFMANLQVAILEAMAEQNIGTYKLARMTGIPSTTMEKRLKQPTARAYRFAELDAIHDILGFRLPELTDTF